MKLVSVNRPLKELQNGTLFSSKLFSKGAVPSKIRGSLFYGTNRNGTEHFRHIILRNGTGSNAHTTYIAIKLPSVVLAFPVSKGLYILGG